VEVRPGEVCLAEVRPFEARPPEVRGGEVRLGEVRLGEVRPAKVRPIEVPLDPGRRSGDPRRLFKINYLEAILSSGFATLDNFSS
jgi:hypothetical protein